MANNGLMPNRYKQICIGGPFHMNVLNDTEIEMAAMSGHIRMLYNDRLRRSRFAIPGPDEPITAAPTYDEVMYVRKEIFVFGVYLWVWVWDRLSSIEAEEAVRRLLLFPLEK